MVKMVGRHQPADLRDLVHRRRWVTMAAVVPRFWHRSSTARPPENTAARDPQRHTTPFFRHLYVVIFQVTKENKDWHVHCYSGRILHTRRTLAALLLPDAVIPMPKEIPSTINPNRYN